MVNQRNQRLSQEIQKSISEILLREISDPRLIDVTIAGVDVTNDLSFATVYYLTESDKAGDNQKVQAGLESAKNLIKKKLSAQLTTFKTPDLIFKRDQSIEYGNHIEGLLDKLKKDGQF